MHATPTLSKKRRASRAGSAFADWSFPDEDNHICRDILIAGDWEPEVGQAIRDSANPSWLFLDLGAHIGYFSHLATPLFRHVIAVEPLQYQHLVANNPFIETHNVAVTDQDGLVDMWAVTPNTGMSWVCTPREGSVIVRSATLTTILGDRRPEIIKCDIEGAEYLAFKDNDVLDHCQVLISEYCTSQLERTSGCSGRQYHDLVCEAGLSWFRMDGRPLPFREMATGGYENYVARRL